MSIWHYDNVENLFSSLKNPFYTVILIRISLILIGMYDIILNVNNFHFQETCHFIQNQAFLIGTIPIFWQPDVFIVWNFWNLQLNISNFTTVKYFSTFLQPYQVRQVWILTKKLGNSWIKDKLWLVNLIILDYILIYFCLNEK